MDRIVIDIPDSAEEAFTVDLEVDATVLDLPEDEVRYPTPGSLSILVEPVGNGYVLTGKLKLASQMECSRCLEPVAVLIDEPFRCVLSKVSVEASPEEDWVLLDKDSREFDATSLVRELILIGLPSKPLCMETCRGLCSECGGNLNVGACTCAGSRTDPRWAGLADIRERLDILHDRNAEERKDNGSSKEKSIKEPTE